MVLHSPFRAPNSCSIRIISVNVKLSEYILGPFQIRDSNFGATYDITEVQKMQQGTGLAELARIQ